jgi:PAS domain-containing protein
VIVILVLFNYPVTSKIDMKHTQSIQIGRKGTSIYELRSFFSRLYLKYVETGIYPGIDPIDARKTILLNKFTSVSIIVSFTLSIFFYFLERTLLSFLLFFLFVLHFQIFIYQLRKNFSLAKYSYFLFNNLFIVFFTSFFGLGSGMIYFFLPIIIQTYLFFYESEIKEKGICLGISFLSLLFLEFTNYSFFLVEKLNPVFEKFLSIYSLISVGIISMYLIILILKLKETPDTLLNENKKLQKYLEKEIFTRQEAYESLAFSVKMQKEVMEGIHGGIIIIDKNGFIQNSNRSFDEMFSLIGENSIKGGNFFDEMKYIYRESLHQITEIKENLEKVLLGEQGYREFEIEKYSPPQKEFLSLKISEIRNSSFHGAILMHHNISELKRAKNKLKHLKAIHLQLETVLPDIMLNLTKEGTIKDFHADKSSSLYFPKESMIGKNLKEFSLPESVFLELEKTFSQVMETGNSHKIRYHFEVEKTAYTYEACFLKSDSEELMVVLKKLKEIDLD